MIFISVLWFGLVVSVSSSSIHYYVFQAAYPFPANGGIVNATKLCRQTAYLTYKLSNAAFHSYPILYGSPALASWSDTQAVLSLATGEVIASGQTFRNGFPPLTKTLQQYGVCSPNTSVVWTGLSSGFTESPSGSCVGWSSLSGNAKTGSCLDTFGWMSVGNTIACSSGSGGGSNPSSASILCVYNGTTSSPSVSPTTRPTKSPSRQAHVHPYPTRALVRPLRTRLSLPAYVRANRFRFNPLYRTLKAIHLRKIPHQRTCIAYPLVLAWYVALRLWCWHYLRIGPYVGEGKYRERGRHPAKANKVNCAEMSFLTVISCLGFVGVSGSLGGLHCIPMALRLQYSC